MQHQTICHNKNLELLGKTINSKKEHYFHTNNHSQKVATKKQIYVSDIFSFKSPTAIDKLLIVSNIIVLIL